MKNKISVQLYTLREQCEKDLPGVLRELASIGYSAVEFAGLHGYDPELIKSVLAETGLRVSGMHCDVLGNPDGALEEARMFGTKNLICGGLWGDMQNEEGFRTAKSKLNETAARLRAEGYRIYYHNHAFEFDTIVDGVDALSYMLKPTEDNLILGETDVYWLKKGGRDPLTFLQPLAGRVPLLHMKDMTDDEEKTYAEVGTGTIDFEAIIRWAEASGVEWYVVEQDVCKTDPMECVRTSYVNLSGLMDRIG